jgi:hypothetical protein
MTPFEAYTKYLAYKLHFSSPTYDYFKYNGKTGAKSVTFETRKDKYQFYKLSKIDDLDNYLVANLMDKPDVWVGELLSEKSQLKYSEMIKRHQSLGYQFQTELNKLDSIPDSIKCQDGKHPPMLKMYKQGLLSPETLVVMNRLMGIFKYWDNKIDETYLWPSIKLKLNKYDPFLRFDEQKFEKILKDCINR